jgi:broad specificity phosphatase PhoE
MKVVLLRHGQSKGNVSQIIDSKMPGTSLTSKGIEQVKQLRDELKEMNLAKAYCSPFQRTIQTFEYLDLNIPLILDKRIKELDYGQFNKRKVTNISDEIGAVFKNAKQGNLNMRLGKSGETMQELINRVKSFWSEIEENNENVLIISHKSVIIEMLKLDKRIEGEIKSKVKCAKPIILEVNKD